MNAISQTGASDRTGNGNEDEDEGTNGTLGYAKLS